MARPLPLPRLAKGGLLLLITRVKNIFDLKTRGVGGIFVLRCEQILFLNSSAIVTRKCLGLQNPRGRDFARYGGDIVVFRSARGSQQVMRLLCRLRHRRYLVTGTSANG